MQYPKSVNTGQHKSIYNWFLTPKTRQTEEDVGNLRKGIGLEFAKSHDQRAEENRKNGRNWSRNHLWCPNDHPG